MTTQLRPIPEADILIVDDTPDNLRLLAKMLESQGYSVRKSITGKMALQSIHRHPPDLILLDITMPDMNGYEVCKQLKAAAETAHIPVIFISALDQIDDKVQAFESGGQDYITKPFQELEVLMRVRNQLLIQQQRKQLIEQNQRLEQEIQDRLKAEAAVRQLSLTDELTGLYNRRGFSLLAEQQLKMAQRTQSFCCLLFADLDGLKQINDSLGHEMGDRMLVDVAQVLKKTFRDSDIVARLGGDEFVILIPACSSDNSEDFSARLQAAIHHFNQVHDRAYQLSISVGAQICPPTAELPLEDLVAKADKLMYDHKRLKRAARH